MTSSANQKTTLSVMREKKNAILQIKRSQATKDEYIRISKRVVRHDSQKTGIDFLAYIDSQNFIRANPKTKDPSKKPPKKKDPLCKTSIYTCKAGLQYGIAMQLKNALSQHDKMRKSGEPKKEYLAERRRAERLFAALEKLEADHEAAATVAERNAISKQCKTKEERKVALADLPRSPYENYAGYQKNSKRKSLKGLPSNWQSQYLNCVKPEYKMNILIMAMTGCRPGEFAKGIGSQAPGVLAQLDKDGIVNLRVFGIKKGQIHRNYKLDPDTIMFAQVLKDLIIATGGKPRIVGLPEGKTVKQLCNHASHIGRKIFNDVSLYSLRHQFSANIKAEESEKAKAEIIAITAGYEKAYQTKYINDNKHRLYRLSRDESRNDVLTHMTGHMPLAKAVIRKTIWDEHMKKVAACLGQKVTRTQQNYGAIAQGGKATGLIDIKASGPIKVSDTRDLGNKDAAAIAKAAAKNSAEPIVEPVVKHIPDAQIIEQQIQTYSGGPRF